LRIALEQIRSLYSRQDANLPAMTSDAQFAVQAFPLVELFRDLPAAALAAVAGSARVRRLTKDVRVFGQGDEGVRAHIVIKGGVRIEQSGSDGGRVVVRFIGRNQMFGTVALFTDGRYPADAITVLETLEASWSEVELRDLMVRHPQIAINAIRVVGARLQEAQDRVRELATQRVEQRVAHALLRLVRQSNGDTVGTATITFPLRRKDIADISGTTLHTASRLLTAWEKAGFLVSESQHLTIRQPARLRKIAENAAD
jgi:CRP-like cAMP-binding protein